MNHIFHLQELPFETEVVVMLSSMEFGRLFCLQGNAIYNILMYGLIFFLTLLSFLSECR